MPLPRRLASLPERTLASGAPVRVAASRRARLLGLAWLAAARVPLRVALWFPRCRSVHTFGMRFALDLVWLDAAGAVVRVDLAVPPRRVRACRRARSVVERRSASGRPPPAEPGGEPQGARGAERDRGDRGEHDEHDFERDKPRSRDGGRREPAVGLAGGQMVDEPGPSGRAPA